MMVWKLKINFLLGRRPCFQEWVVSFRWYSLKIPLYCPLRETKQKIQLRKFGKSTSQNCRLVRERLVSSQDSKRVVFQPSNHHGARCCSVLGKVECRGWYPSFDPCMGVLDSPRNTRRMHDLNFTYSLAEKVVVVTCFSLRKVWLKYTTPIPVNLVPLSWSTTSTAIFSRTVSLPESCQ